MKQPGPHDAVNSSKKVAGSYLADSGHRRPCKNRGSCRRKQATAFFVGAHPSGRENTISGPPATCLRDYLTGTCFPIQSSSVPSAKMLFRGPVARTVGGLFETGAGGLGPPKHVQQAGQRENYLRWEQFSVPCGYGH